MQSDNRFIFRFAGWTFAILLVLLLIVAPLAISLLCHWSGSMSPEATRMLNLAERFLSVTLFLFALTWIFFLGASFASFLNVVAWRIPRGRSILGSSCCPHCARPIAFRDNVPVIGWLKSGGRCSMCREPISSRYLGVEIILGSIFVAVTAGEMLTGGITLPIREPDRMLGLNWMFFEPKFELIQIMIAHATMIMVIFTFALVEMDSLPIPRTIWMIGASIGLGISVIFPAAVLVNWNFPLSASHWPYSRMDALAANVSGAVVGSILGAFCRLAAGRTSNACAVPPASHPTAIDLPEVSKPSENHPTAIELPEASTPADVDSLNLVLGLSTVGLYLGWQSAMTVGLYWIVTKAVFTRCRCSTNGLLLLLTLFHLATWRWFNLLL